MDGDRRGRFGMVAGVVLLIAISWWGVTYIPGIRDTVPSIVTIDTTTRVDVVDLSPDGETMNPDVIDDACHNIPFLMRPLAGGTAHNAKIVVTRAGVELGEVNINCQTGEVISDEMY